MINISVTDSEKIFVFFFIFLRILGIFMQMPLMDQEGIPARLKILCTIVVSFSFYTTLESEIREDMAFIANEYQIWILSSFYLLSGLLIGLVLKSILAIFLGSGAIITQQVGLSMVRYFDPTASQSIGPFERMIQWAIIVLILSSGALHPIFSGIIKSFSGVKLATIGSHGMSAAFFLEFFKEIFMSSLLLAFPFIFINLLIMLVLGIIARMVPQMNVLMVSFVVNIGLGLLVFVASSDEFFQVGVSKYAKLLGVWLERIA